MIIQPKIRGHVCITAHPQGCANMVAEQIAYTKTREKVSGPKNVLIIGASTGYGLASRITATFAGNANTIGAFFEKAADEKRPASAGWYNTVAFEKAACDEGRYAKSINGDAFSDETKQRVIELIKHDLKKIDLVIYSLASPRRIHPATGEMFISVLKPIGKSFTSKTVDPFRGEVKDITIGPATEKEIANTIAVMGGDDWQLWIDHLLNENVLTKGATTVAYSYIGPQLTHAVYKDGTIGKAKEHLKATADKIHRQLRHIDGRALISVNKAVVTQASAAIPVVPLYISLLLKLMKAKGTHEGCIEQTYRLFKDYLSASELSGLDGEGNIRLDDLEMADEIQEKIASCWPLITTENVKEMTDIKGYCEDFNRLFGFQVAGVDYNKEVDPIIDIPSIKKL